MICAVSCVWLYFLGVVGGGGGGRIPLSLTLGRGKGLGGKLRWEAARASRGWVCFIPMPQTTPSWWDSSRFGLLRSSGTISPLHHGLTLCTPEVVLPPQTPSRELEPNFSHVLGDEELAGMVRKHRGSWTRAKVYAGAR